MANIVEQWLTFSWGPNIWAILIATIVALVLPLLVHLLVYRRTAPTALPTFVLIGPTGAGKTALLTLVCYHRMTCKY